MEVIQSNISSSSDAFLENAKVSKNFRLNYLEKLEEVRLGGGESNVADIISAEKIGQGEN